MAVNCVNFHLAIMKRTKSDDGKIRFNFDAWREARPPGISRRKLAASIGTTDSNLIYIEQGKSTPSLILAFKYCDFVHLPIEKLCVKN
jgi:DNA-binding XRE family transcriptional regulator